MADHRLKMAGLTGVAVRNVDYQDGRDYIPTPPWATRAFLAVSGIKICRKTVLEPACGAGHMSKEMTAHGAIVTSMDLVDRGFPGAITEDFLSNSFGDGTFDWVITNPPFALADSFFPEMWRLARVGVVLHIRTGWLNGARRHERILSRIPPSEVYMHAKNVSATQNRVIRRGSNVFNHSWVVWHKDFTTPDTLLRFIPPDSQTRFERPEDYE
jgi:hypothetical protein